MKYFIPILFGLSCSAHAMSSHLEVSQGVASRRSLVFDIRKIDKETAYVVTEKNGNNIVNETAVPKSVYVRLESMLELAIPSAKRKHLFSSLACTQLVVIRTDESDVMTDSIDFICLDTADRVTRDNFSRWWSGIVKIMKAI
jgi:hypothetical protein